MADDREHDTSFLTAPWSRRTLLRVLAAGAGGLLVAVGAASTLASDDDDNDQDDDDQDDDDHSGHGGGDDDGDDEGDNSGRGGGDNNDVAITGEIPSGSIQILIDDDDADAFSPGSLTVDVGQSVTFINADDDPHTATGSGFDTGTIQPGGTATIVLDTPGTFAYACALHPQMQGTVEVTGEAIAVTDATPAADAPVAGGISGDWTVVFIPAPDTGVSPLHAAITFHDGGTLDAVFPNADESGLDVALGPAHGTWSDDGAGTLHSVVVTFLLDVEDRYAGTLTIRQEIDLDDADATYQGAFLFRAEDANGEELASGEGTSQGERAHPNDVTVVVLATPAVSSAGTATVVTILDFAFEPREISIPTGGTLTWVNEGNAPHTATANNGEFDTGQLAPGEEGSQTFDQPGSYPYFCAIHPDMQGTVVVS